MNPVPSPRSKERGSVEADQSLMRFVVGIESPRSKERGSVEAFFAALVAAALAISPRSKERGSVEATAIARSRKSTLSNLRARKSAAPLKRPASRWVI